MIHRTETWLRAVAFPGVWLVSLLFHDRLLALPTLCLWKRFTGFEWRVAPAPLGFRCHRLPHVGVRRISAGTSSDGGLDG